MIAENNVPAQRPIHQNDGERGLMTRKISKIGFGGAGQNAPVVLLVGKKAFFFR